MDSARQKREQAKSEPAVADRGKGRAPIASPWTSPLTLKDAHSPALRLGQGFGSSSPTVSPLMQAKLTVSAPGDQYEQEADRVADQVMRMPDSNFHLQRKCGCGESSTSGESCAACESRDQPVQRRTAAQVAPTTTPPFVHWALRSPGQPLDRNTRAFFEQRFRHDFSNVRIHTDEQAAKSARGINAQAYTVGQNIVFASGRYAPGTAAGTHLLAHELTHVIQQAPGVHRQAGIIPVGPLDTGADRARRYQPTMRPHVPTAPTISPPPLVRGPDVPSPCPSRADVLRDIRASDIGSQTQNEMQHDINLARSRSSLSIPSSRRLIVQADQAIRAVFGSLLPAGRNYASPASVTTRTPQEFSELRVPDDAAARRRIADVALEVAERQLTALCITDPANPVLQSEIVAPLFGRVGLTFVREYERGRIGGQTTFPVRAGRVQPHVDIPSASRNIGHIIVHEGLHFYVSEVYQNTAEAGSLTNQLMEGGAEFLARHVINTRLTNDPNFRINTGTYANQFWYVANYLLRGGVSSFALAYFQGRVDLLGLTPPVQPKLAMGQQNDADEIEANRMADWVTSEIPAGTEPRSRSQTVAVRLQRLPDPPVQSPHDRMVVERARRRLPLLQQYVGEWAAREARRMRATRERTALLDSRSRMDREGADPGESIQPGYRIRDEMAHTARLNRRPLDISVTEEEIRIRVRFHVRFEDSAQANRLGELQTALQAGIDLVWNQEMRGEVFGGRRLVVEPATTLISATAARDRNYWLITVRPGDRSPAVYPGCQVHEVPDVPTSVTDSDCDGGVMSIPPAHITRAGVLGHEMLHLFGLIDRYALVQGIPARGPRWHRNDPTRDTGGRLDPLGAQDARILREDVAFLFDRLGVYEMEANRGLDTLRSLEQEGLTIGTVRGQIHRLEEIIRLGRDPNSLLPIRRDFTDRMTRGAEDL